MIKETVPIINKLGLHARAAAKLVSTATRYSSEIKVVRNGKEVDGKSIMSVMMLAASCGTDVDIIVEGADEEIAITALKELIADRFGEGE
jgi:phosphocarrier protein HPr